MNLLDALILCGLYRVYAKVSKKVRLHPELQMYDALYRIGRWCVVVAATWVVVAILLGGLELVDVYNQIAATFRPNTLKPQEVCYRFFFFPS